MKVVSATNHLIPLFQFQNKRKHIESCESLCLREGLGDLVAEMVRPLGVESCFPGTRATQVRSRHFFLNLQNSKTRVAFKWCLALNSLGILV